MESASSIGKTESASASVNVPISFTQAIWAQVWYLLTVSFVMVGCCAIGRLVWPSHWWLATLYWAGIRDLLKVCDTQTPGWILFVSNFVGYSALTTLISVESGNHFW